MTRTQKELFVKMFDVQADRVVFVDDKEDPLYAFWQMVKKELLPTTCLVVIPEIPLNMSVADLKEYGVTRVGRGAVFNYDTLTQPGVKPSQRGLFMRR